MGFAKGPTHPAGLAVVSKHRAAVLAPAHALMNHRTIDGGQIDIVIAEAVTSQTAEAAVILTGNSAGGPPRVLWPVRSRSAY
jgi:hypothetical protein